MKTINSYAPLLIALLFITPLSAFGSFERDLHYGMLKNEDVASLQEFLTSEGLYDGPIGGNFFSLTKDAVKAFQKQEMITPIEGFFGEKTREKANEINDLILESSKDENKSILTLDNKSDTINKTSLVIATDTNTTLSTTPTDTAVEDLSQKVLDLTTANQALQTQIDYLTATVNGLVDQINDLRTRIPQTSVIPQATVVPIPSKITTIMPTPKPTTVVPIPKTTTVVPIPKTTTVAH